MREWIVVLAFSGTGRGHADDAIDRPARVRADAVRYVDGDATACPGDGSDATPFCTLQDALDDPSLAAGVHIRVRTAAGPYAGADASGIDGEADAPIVLEPDDGHTPIIAGRVSLVASSHWTIRGLMFDGSQLDANVEAIDVETTEEIVEGIVVEGNTILGWGGAPITDPSDDGYSGGAITVAAYVTEGSAAAMVGPRIVGNRVLGPRASGIRLYDVVDGVVEGNEITGARCQWELGNSGVHSTGIRVHRGSGSTVRGNYVHDFAPSCEIDGTRRMIGIWLQTAQDAEITANLVRGIVVDGSYGMGIDLINGSNDARVHHNIVTDVGQCGLCLGAVAAGGGDRTRWVANTVVHAGDYGMDVYQGVGPDVRDNLFVDAGEAFVRVFHTATEVAIDHNLYWTSGDAAVGRLDYTDQIDLATWIDACACDQASVFADPRLPDAPEDVTPGRDGAAIDAGIDDALVAYHNGAAVDFGALEAPVPGAARIDADDPTAIVLAIESSGAAPLRFDPGCVGLTATGDGEPLRLVGCELADGGALRIELDEPALAGAIIELAYAGASISDSARIGGLVDAIVPASTIAVDNGSTELPAGSGTDTTTSGSSGSTTGADPAETSRGCGCGQGRAAGGLAWLALLLLRRRRRAPLAGLALGLTACFGDRTYPCERSEQCRVDGRMGTCEPVGFCSYPDDRCASRSRYGPHAPDEIADRCVEDEGETSTQGAATTSATPSCGDGHIDPGETCDDGNDIAADGCNDDCETSGTPMWSLTEPAAVANDLAWMGETLVIAGAAITDATGRDVLVTARDPDDGGELWRVVLDSGLGDDDVAWGVAAGSDAIVVVGSETTAAGLRAIVRGLDGTGNVTWNHAFDSLADDAWRAIDRDDAGTLWITGAIAGSGTLATYDADGTERWTRGLSGLAGTIGLDVAVAGSIAAVAGSLTGDGEGTDLFARGFGGDGATLVALERAGGPGDAGLAVARFADADLLVAGVLTGSPYAARFAAAGELRWENNAICGADDGAVHDAAIDGAGHIVLAGSHGPRGWLAKLDPDSGRRWCVDLDEVREVAGIVIGEGDAIFAAGSTADDALWLARVRP